MAVVMGQIKELVELPEPLQLLVRQPLAELDGLDNVGSCVEALRKSFGRQSCGELVLLRLEDGGFVQVDLNRV